LYHKKREIESLIAVTSVLWGKTGRERAKVVGEHDEMTTMTNGTQEHHVLNAPT
jgi:hypothetical protein